MAQREGDILSRLGAALERRTDQRESLTPGALSAMKQQRTAAAKVSVGAAISQSASGFSGLTLDTQDSPAASQHVRGLQEISPSPGPGIFPFNLLPNDGWDIKGDIVEPFTSHPSFGSTPPFPTGQEIHPAVPDWAGPLEVTPDVRSHFDRNASVDVSVATSPTSPQKSIHALKATEERDAGTRNGEGQHIRPTSPTQKSIHAIRAQERNITPSLHSQFLSPPSPVIASSESPKKNPSAAQSHTWHGPLPFALPSQEKKNRIPGATVQGTKRLPSLNLELEDACLSKLGIEIPETGQTPARPLRPQESSSESAAQPQVDEVPVVEMQEVDELTMETLVLAENHAVQHVVVAGCGRQYMACLVTLKVEEDWSRLAPQALNFARSNGSEATTIEEAKMCSAFHVAMLKAFTVCNKTVWATSKKPTMFTISKSKPPQLRRYTILPEQFTVLEQTLHPDGSVNRARVLELYSDVVESMYGAATTGTSDPICVTPMLPATLVKDGFSVLEDRKVPQPIDFQVNNNYNESESAQSNLDTQAAVNGEHQGVSDLNNSDGFSPSEKAARFTLPTIHNNQLFCPASPLPQIERAPYVLSKEPTPNFAARMCSYFKTFLPCLVTHSQLLDDDVLNPGHTVVKRAEPGRKPSAKRNTDGKNS